MKMETSAADAVKNRTTTTTTTTAANDDYQKKNNPNQNQQQNNKNSINEKTELTANDLKEKGNVCVRKGDFEEAVTFYTEAIKLNPNDSALYSNRSLVFLRLKQYYYASTDADTVIQLNPNWAKGHYRKAEVLTAVGHYDSALLHYGRALQLRQGDRSIIDAAQKAATLGNQQTEYERRLPWVGAGIGIIVGVIISLCDALLTETPTLKHPAVMVLLVIAIAGIGYIIARSIRYYQRLHKRSLLEAPTNLNKEFCTQDEIDNDNENDGNGSETTTNRTRYSRAQARLRLKKGKS